MISMRIGDYAKLFVALATVTFGVCLIGHEQGYLHFFSESYREQGFCISYMDESPLIQGHALSFYSDAAMALVMFLLVREGEHKGFSEMSLRPIKKNTASLFGHGIGHLFLALNSHSGTGASSAFEDLTLGQRVIAFFPLLAVWYGFMRDKTRPFAVAMAYAVMHNTAQVFFLSSRLFFIHVLMAVLLSGAIRGLAREEKDKTRFYDMEAVLVDVPILLMTFSEAITCDSFLKHYGGHVWFDMAVPFGFIAYYMILTQNPEYTSKKME
jgi:hypothetical protein